MPGQYVLSINEVNEDHTPVVGHFSARLGELVREGLPVPQGFTITVNAYEKFKKENNLDIKTRHLINTINFGDPHSVGQVSNIIKKHFMEGNFPIDIANEIYTNYKKIGDLLKDSRVHIKLSPISLHAKHVNFFENIKGESNLIEKVKECWAINFDEHHLLINFNNELNHKSAILIQKLIEPDVSGKIYTANPFDNIKNQILIKAMYGHFETKTNFILLPDQYAINKQSLEILSKEISHQSKMRKELDKEILNVPMKLRKKQKITDEKIIELARLAKRVEKIYFFPQEIDWSIQKDQIYLTSIKPITHISQSYSG